jgi:hypothetical protein
MGSRQPSNALRLAVFRERGNSCVYCGGDADSLDHVTPYNADPVHLETNLVPACRLCNSIASDRVFQSLSHKRAYILRRRRERADTQIRRRHFRMEPASHVIETIDDDSPKNEPAPRIEIDPMSARANLRARALASSWARVADELGVSKAALWRFVNQGHEPKNADDRRRLGLLTMMGHFPPGTIFMGQAVLCRCGRAFIGVWGNRRRLCPVCRPPRKIRRG